jgi:hypothetical protein
MQLFLWAKNSFFSYIHKPAFLSSFIGDFITQFYLFKGLGPLLITIILFFYWLLFKKIAYSIFKVQNFFFLSFIPVAIVTSLLFYISYFITSVISYLLCFIFFILYTRLSNTIWQKIIGIVFLPFVYYLIGGYVFVYVLFIALYEFFITNKKQVYIYVFILLLSSLSVAFFSHYIFLFTIEQSFFYPSLLEKKWQMLLLLSVITPLLLVIIKIVLAKIKIKSNLSAVIQFIVLFLICFKLFDFVVDPMQENILALDHEANKGNWSKVYSLSEKYKMRNNISAYYTNLALLQTDQLPEKLMETYQPESKGLFIPVSPAENYMTITFSNEAYYLLGDVNSSQHAALLAMIFSPKTQSSRLLKRLIEINIINGEYAVAEKYINILSKTWFYHNWAEDKRKFLYNENECRKASWIVEKRQQLITVDTIKRSNEYEETLQLLITSHPQNKKVLDYLLCYYLLNKDVNDFYNLYEKYRSKISDKIPSVYQQALMIHLAATKASDDIWKTFKFDKTLADKFISYTNDYQNSGGNGTLLKENFEKTYWFYYHFAQFKENKH